MVNAGSGLIGRITEAVVAHQNRSQTSSAAQQAGVLPTRRGAWTGDSHRTANPLSWPGWVWALLTGIGMTGGGIGAAVITLGPVLLWYDLAYLGSGVDALTRLSFATRRVHPSRPHQSRWQYVRHWHPSTPRRRDQLRQTVCSSLAGRGAPRRDPRLAAELLASPVRTPT